MEQFRYDEYVNLIGAVIRSGLEREGPGYLTTYGGRYWCELGNLDAEALMSMAVRIAGKSFPKEPRAESNAHAIAPIEVR